MSDSVTTSRRAALPAGVNVTDMQAVEICEIEGFFSWRG